MKLTHTLKLPGAQQYEMRYVECEASDADLPPIELTIREKWSILQFMVQQQCLISGVTSGHMDAKNVAESIAALRKGFINDALAEKLKSYGV
jgi:hypothetical protein